MPIETSRPGFVKQSLIVLIAVLGFSLGAAMKAMADDGAVATGVWGGEHVIMEISEGGAAMEFDCAWGQIKSPIALDKRGDFDVAGTFTPEHGGPVRRDESPPRNPARYTGHVSGQTMKLTVTVGKEEMGVFTLNRGSRANLMKCR